MMSFERINPFGLRYKMTEVFSPTPQTAIRLGEKLLVVNHSIHDINQGWYHWMNGKFIQDSFPFLTPTEREFLMTGLTAEELKSLDEEKE